MRSAPVPVGQAVFAIAVGFAVLFVGLAYACPPRAPVAKVERVSDADTLTGLASNQIKLQIPLLDTDVPEIGRMRKTIVTLRGSAAASRKLG